MKVNMERVIHLAQYESLRYSVEITDQDYPRLSDETPEQHLTRLHFRVYRELLAFAVFHQSMLPEQAKQEFGRFKGAYNLNGHVNG